MTKTRRTGRWIGRWIGRPLEVLIGCLSGSRSFGQKINPEAKTHDYTNETLCSGHDYFFRPLPDAGGRFATMIGWGENIHSGDYLLLSTPNGGKTRYGVDDVFYTKNPNDLWSASVSFAPRTTPTCNKCGSTMSRGIALEQTFVGGSPDFPGDEHPSTFSAGGPGRMVDCYKCPDCGHSVGIG